MTTGSQYSKLLMTEVQKIGFYTTGLSYIDFITLALQYKNKIILPQFGQPPIHMLTLLLQP